MAAAATCNAGGAAATADDAGGPVLLPLGPDAEHYGADEGFPVRRPLEDPQNRVGAFSHFDRLYPTRQIARAALAWRFQRRPIDIRYTYQGRRYAIADYVARNPVTGLLIAQDGDILCEFYQYGRTDRDRFISQSMAKSIVGMLVGIAIADRAIRSVDDKAETYVPGFKGTEYGRTPIRDLLHMSSGVAFGEAADNGRDLDRLWFDLMGGYLRQNQGKAKGTVRGITQFNQRVAPPGTRFAYASIEADVLGIVLRYATGQSLSDYLHAKVWDRIGTEANAAWLVDAQGFEVAHGFLNAVLRDYARLGRLLAHDGAWEGRQIVPAQWMIDATTLRQVDAYLAPGKADPTFGYGYLVWLLPWGKRQFGLFGAYGQRICIDPRSRLVLVQTSVDERPELWSLWRALSAQLGGA